MRQSKCKVEVSWKFFWKWFQRLLITVFCSFLIWGFLIDPIVQMVHEAGLKKECELQHNRPCKLVIQTIAVPK